jgi:hypothetical protein
MIEDRWPQVFKILCSRQNSNKMTFHVMSEFFLSFFLKFILSHLLPLCPFSFQFFTIIPSFPNPDPEKSMSNGKAIALFGLVLPTTERKIKWFWFFIFNGREKWNEKILSLNLLAKEIKKNGRLENIRECICPLPLDVEMGHGPSNGLRLGGCAESE